MAVSSVAVDAWAERGPSRVDSIDATVKRARVDGTQGAEVRRGSALKEQGRSEQPDGGEGNGAMRGGRTPTKSGAWDLVTREFMETGGREEPIGGGSGALAPPPIATVRGAEEADTRKRRRGGTSIGASGNALGRKALVAAWSGGGCSDEIACAGECAGGAIGAAVGGDGRAADKKGEDEMQAQSVGEETERRGQRTASGAAIERGVGSGTTDVNGAPEGKVPAGNVGGSDDGTPAADAMQKAFYQVGVDVSSKGPRRSREVLVATAAASVRRHPTVPADPEDPAQPWSRALAEGMAVELPAVHCAFAGCIWQSEDADELYEHVREVHGDVVLPIAELVHPFDEDEDLRIAAAYHEIVAHAVRGGAPLSAYPLHRRSLKMYAKATQRKSIASPICFVCACTFPWVRSRRGNQISWEQPFKAAPGNPSVVSHFGGWTMSEVQVRFSVDAYMRDYQSEPGNGALDLDRDAWGGKDFDDWFVAVPTSRGEVKILCCPEDQLCHKGCVEKGAACPECSVPLCAECKVEVDTPRRWRVTAVPTVPRRSLANDLMAFYAPDRMYTEGMTVMEIM